MNNVVIIGSGMAGYTLAKEIRKRDEKIVIQLITQDNGSFYSKPMISNAFAKNQTANQLVINTAHQMAEKFQLDIITNTRLHSIDRDNKEVITEHNKYPYSNLVLATGAQAIHVPIQGNASNEIFTVNSLHDYKIFRKAITDKKHVTILGAGLIGCEFANDLTTAGYKVELIDLANQPLGRLLPDKPATVLKHKFSDLGIKWHLSHSLKEINRAESGFLLTLNDNSTFTTDIVLSAIGLKPNTALAEIAGLNINRGIVSNQYLQTSDKNIYALGDCTEINGMVLPFIMPIMVATRALANTLTGNKTEAIYPPMPVAVKTPAYPVVICPPPPGSEGQWLEESSNDNIVARFERNDQLIGFALTGETVKNKQQLTKELSI